MADAEESELSEGEVYSNSTAKSRSSSLISFKKPSSRSRREYTKPPITPNNFGRQFLKGTPIKTSGYDMNDENYFSGAPSSYQKSNNKKISIGNWGPDQAN